MVKILFPGRHHLMTKFQLNYLNDILHSSLKDYGIDISEPVEEIIFAVTSADHSNTRRNPLPLYLRTIALEDFCKDLKVKTRIFPIPDIPTTDKFAEYIIKQIFHQSLGTLNLNPKNCVVLSSTPSVIKQFEKLGFKILFAELVSRRPERYSTLRPYEVMNLLVKAGKKWRTAKEWKKYASLATQNLYYEYNLGDLIIELYNDSLLTEEGKITETREYEEYARQMDAIVKLKYADIKPFIVPGKIADAGCGTGSLIKLIAKDFRESDIIGIEAVRKFYEYCRSQKYPHEFVFFYRRNILAQNFKANSINTFIYSSVLHEIYSYLGKSALRKLLRNTFKQLAFKGRIIIRDVVGPENKNKKVLMKLCSTDGKSTGNIKTLSTKARFFKFAREFRYKVKFKIVNLPEGEFIKLSLKDAYEFMSKKDYLTNWESELKEEFGFWSFSEWVEELKKVGFKIVSGSKVFSNPWIIENRYKGAVELCELGKEGLKPVDFPPTNMILVGEKAK